MQKTLDQKSFHGGEKPEENISKVMDNSKVFLFTVGLVFMMVFCIATESRTVNTAIAMSEMAHQSNQQQLELNELKKHIVKLEKIAHKRFIFF